MGALRTEPRHPESRESILRCHRAERVRDSYFTRTPVHGFDPQNGEPLFDNEGAFYRDERDPGVYQVVPDIELYSVTSFADRDFEIADRSANVYYEFYYNHRSFESTSGYRQFFPAVPRTNPTNPFGLYGPLGGFGGFTVLPVLPSYELLDPRSLVEVDRINLFVGLTGDLSESWSYDATSAIAGRKARTRASSS